MSQATDDDDVVVVVVVLVLVVLVLVRKLLCRELFANKIVYFKKKLMFM